MDIEKEKELATSFPKLYEQLMFGFECEDGWFEIIKDLSIKLEKLAKELPEGTENPLRVTTVKEKYGTLSFYTNWCTDAMDEVIEEACDRSGVTCEICGNPGTLQKQDGWWMVRCKECTGPTLPF